MKKVYKGLTLMEIILAVILLLILVTFVGRFTNLTSKAFKSATDEFAIQADMRKVMLVTNERITKTTGAFSVTNFDTNNLSPTWDYIGIETIEVDGILLNQVVEMTYDIDSKIHRKTVIAPPKKGVMYEFSFEKEFNTVTNTNLSIMLVSYKVEKYTGTGVKKPVIKEPRVELERIDTSMRATNSIQFVDRGEDGSSVALAFKNDLRDVQTSTAAANLMMVLDYSGSMSFNRVDGKKMRWEYVKEGVNKVLDKLEPFDNALISIVGIGTSYEPSKSTGPAIGTAAYANAKNDYSKLQLLAPNDVNFWKLPRDNGGDAAREAYYRILKQRQIDSSNSRKPKDYYILMIDGSSDSYSQPKGSTGYSSQSKDKPDYYYGDGTFNIDYDVIQLKPDQGLEYARLMSEKIGDLPNLDRYFFIIGDAVDNKTQNVEYPTGIKSVPVITALREALRINEPEHEGVNFLRANKGEEFVMAFDNVGSTIVDGLWFVDGPK